MNNTESILSPFEFDSPVEFVLIGVVGKKRAVVAKSKGAKIDLVAYAQRENRDDDDRTSPAEFFPFTFLFPARMQLKPLSVDSQPTDFYSNHAYDERASEWTLVWRGSGYKRHKEKVKKEFQKRIGDIVEAMDKNSSAQFEWAMSSVIDLCNRATLYSRSKRLRLAYVFWFTTLIYIIGISAYLLSRFALE